MKTRLIPLHHVTDPRGDLSVIEQSEELPFEIKRVFWTYNVPEGKSRGGHAHKQLYELLVAITGEFTVNIHDGTTEKSFHLDTPWQGLLIEPGEWSSEDYFSPGAVCLALCSDVYDEGDYIRDFDEFIKYVQNSKV